MTNCTGFHIKTSVTWSKILIIIDIQISDSSGDKVAEAFCFGQRGEDAELKRQKNQLKCVPYECLGYLSDSEALLQESK